jgi:hypothetical protein
MEPRLTICNRCSSDACYAHPINEIHSSYLCWSCGFYASDLIKEGEYDVQSFERDMPILYTEIKFKDKKGRVWYPSVINNLDKGTVFIQGTSKDNWQWAGMKTRELNEQETKELSNKGITRKSDPSTLKLFGNDFMEAADYIQAFDK